MKVYKLEFTYFDGVNWSYVWKQIITETMDQMEQTFLKEVEFIHEGLTTPQIKWVNVRKNIVEEDFSFPIVQSKEL